MVSGSVQCADPGRRLNSPRQEVGGFLIGLSSQRLRPVTSGAARPGWSRQWPIGLTGPGKWLDLHRSLGATGQQLAPKSISEWGDGSSNTGGPLGLPSCSHSKQEQAAAGITRPARETLWPSEDGG